MKVFIAGPRAITKLNDDIMKKLEKIVNKNITVLVGDANGVDKAVQQFYLDHMYKNVLVYASGKRIRNNVGKWDTVNVDVTTKVKGFDFYTIKDKQMAKDADCGLMIWNGKSKGTFNNILNLVSLKKTVLLYLIPNGKFYKINSMSQIEKLVESINHEEINDFFSQNRFVVEQTMINKENYQ